MGKIRLRLGITLIKSSNLFYKLARTLCVSVLKPDDLVNLTKHCYSLSSHFKGCYSQEYAKSGLEDEEKNFVYRYLKKGATILVVGCGGGRECLALAQTGFKVTGIDFIKECVEAASRNAAKENLNIEFIELDITKPFFQKESKFDAIMLPALLYSLIPSQNKRIDVLRKLSANLKQNGKIFLNFLLAEKFIERNQRFKKVISRLTRGNIPLEDGDAVEGDGEFKHYFNENQIRQEIKTSGFRIEELNLNDPFNSFAVLSKPGD